MSKSVTASIFLVYSVAFLAVGLRYPMLTDGGQFGPGFFPRVTGVVLVGLCAWNLYRERGAERKRAERVDVRDALLILVLLAGYVVGMYLVGMTIPTLVFALLLLLRFNRGRLVANLAFAAALTASVYLAFGVWFDAALPVGLFTVAGLP
ncbi:tripartite tricarboxylate transporter TctB family protein [Actinophytocola sp.]|uniref:tripartite tricarboxylate transporter TctB family protein n=1 Tax=Actinophytocola sp. TaxID=1872138 RepID=UPI003D6B32DF